MPEIHRLLEHSINTGQFRPDGEAPRRLWRLFVALISLCLLCIVLLCVGIGYLIFRPQYVELDIPFPGKGNWTTTEKWVQKQYGIYYIWRRTGIISLDEMEKDAVTAYFDKWLTERGWSRLEEGSCDSYLSQTELPPTGNRNYMVYDRLESGQVDITPPEACVVIWPEPGNGVLRVVLLTENPSVLSAIH